MLGMVLFQVFVSVEAGTAVIFSLLPPILHSQRMIFQRFFAACQGTPDLEKLLERMAISFCLMLAEDVFLSILWLKDDLPLTKAFDLMFWKKSTWSILSISYLGIFLTIFTAAALLPEQMACQDPLDVCSCSKAQMFAELCGCCGVNMTDNPTCQSMTS
ncbi:unnamed protein product [Symbiodinium natans]|uniref:Uncharacterized protein n=1 Tax=Symbiodinium natans TaxID=878477 RepID=A0A812KFA0_9DINO|nr:unnamed protein product [Symbiodinium natans]